MTTVSLVVPCFQEAQALEGFREVLPLLAADEVVFVDDGSTDGTAEGLAALAAADPRVRVVHHDRNRGVGAAMRTGFDAARGSVVVVYDADRTYPPEDVGRLVRALGPSVGLVTVSPWAPGGSAPDVPVLRRWLSQVAATAYRLVLGPRGGGVSTYTCAFRAYRRDQVRTWRHRSDGFGAAAEILGLALLDGAKVLELPSRLEPRRAGRSKMRVGRAAREHLGVLARLWRRRAAHVR